MKRLMSSLETLVARRMEDTDTWKQAGYRSVAEQLAAVSGTSVSSARNMLETSKQVEALPATADAMRAGKLSAAKAEAIASAATVAPDAEAELLAGADAPLAAVRDKCLQAKAVDRDAAHARIRRERHAREFTDKEGAWNFIARGTPDDGAKFRVTLDPIVDEMFKTARAEDRKETREAYAFDAFIELANRASGPCECDGEGEMPTAKKAAPRFMALIRADIEALLRGTVEGDEICEIAGLGPIPAMVARELLGDAVLKLVITKGVDVANVTHLGRSPTVAQQVALWGKPPLYPARNRPPPPPPTKPPPARGRRNPPPPPTSSTRSANPKRTTTKPPGGGLVAGTGTRPFVPPTDPRHPKYRAPPDP